MSEKICVTVMRQDKYRFLGWWPKRTASRSLGLAQLAQNRGVCPRQINALDEKSALQFW